MVPPTPKLCTSLNLACQDNFFHTLQRPIRHTVPDILRETPKKDQIISLTPIFTTRGTTYPKVMHTVESGLLRWFFWHLAKSNRTYGSRDIKCWENYGAAAAAGAGAAAAAAAQYNSIHYDIVQSGRYCWCNWICGRCNNFLTPIFTTRGATYPKVMHTVESGLSRQFPWHLEKWYWTYCYGFFKS